MPEYPARPPGGLTRRRLGQLAGVAVGGAAIEGLLPDPIAAALTVDGLQPFSMAMHQHASFSEQTGSLDSALDQARLNGVNVIWWTDHDHRMLARRYRREVHFTNLTSERTDGPPWAWVLQRSGPLTTSSSGGIVAAPASPKDPVSGGSLHVSAQSTTAATAKLGYFAESHPAGWNYHCNAFGQRWTLEVLPRAVGPQAYLELLLSTSHHPARGGRPAGIYQISYRFGGPGTPGTRTRSGLLGIVNIRVTAGQWNSVTIVPSNDITGLWPDLPPEDFATSGFSLNAVSTGSRSEGYFDYLRFSRPYAVGSLPLQLQQRIEAAYAVRYPSVRRRQAVEVSRFLPHLNWFGGAVSVTDAGSITSGDNTAPYEVWLAQLVPKIHSAGGLASYNHPYGYDSGPLLDASVQNAQLSKIAAHLLANSVLGCDILEVGYVSRNGVDLAHHLGLWDVLSRHALFVTGNGVTDDHAGTNWRGIHNNWTTTAWSTDDSEAALLRALAAGRVWTSSLAGFSGTLDLRADGHPMGSVSVSSLPSRQLQVLATGLPAGSSVEVLRGNVDYAGSTPNTIVIARVPAASFPTGSVTVPVDTTRSCFVRVQVRNSAGVLVAVSNPVWMLRQQPPSGIPAPRAR